MRDESRQIFLTRRTALGGLFGMTAASLSLGRTDSIGFPRTLIVPFAAGGTADSLGRKLAQLLSKTSNSSLTVENIPGASGAMAVSQILKQPRDGATLLLGNSGLICATPLLMKGQSEFDPQVDLVPVCTVADAPFLLFSGKDFPANNLKDLQRLYAGSSEHLAYSTNEIGSANHIGGEVILQRLGLQGTHVPYRVTSQAVIDVIEARVQIGVFSYQNIAPFLANGKAKVLCTLSNSRLEVLPQATTVMDQGFGKFDIQGWNALFIASGTPQSVVQGYEARIRSIFDHGDIQAFIKRMGNIPAFRDHERSEVFVNEEILRYRNLLLQYKLI